MTAEQNVTTAEAYYKAWSEKDIARMRSYLHPEVQFLSPVAQLSGREAVLEAAARPLPILQGIDMRARFGAADQVMLAFDLRLAEPIGVVRSAVLMTFKDGLIARNELFFDARPFEKR
jgi:ketosteroid isomerase-like protein